MGIAGEGKVGQIFRRLRTSLRVYLARRRVAAQHLGDLEVEEVGGVEGLAGRGQSIGDAHLRSRSALTALAGGTRGVTGVR